MKMSKRRIRRRVRMTLSMYQAWVNASPNFRAARMRDLKVALRREEESLKQARSTLQEFGNDERTQVLADAFERTIQSILFKIEALKRSIAANATSGDDQNDVELKLMIEQVDAKTNGLIDPVLVSTLEQSMHGEDSSHA